MRWTRASAIVVVAAALAAPAGAQTLTVTPSAVVKVGESVVFTPACPPGTGSTPRLTSSNNVVLPVQPVSTPGISSPTAFVGVGKTTGTAVVTLTGGVAKKEVSIQVVRSSGLSPAERTQLAVRRPAATRRSEPAAGRDGHAKRQPSSRPGSAGMIRRGRSRGATIPCSRSAAPAAAGGGAKLGIEARCRASGHAAAGRTRAPSGVVSVKRPRETGPATAGTCVHSRRRERGGTASTWPATTSHATSAAARASGASRFARRRQVSDTASERPWQTTSWGVRGGR